jgi:hypothetical protein
MVQVSWPVLRVLLVLRDIKAVQALRVLLALWDIKVV